MVSSTRSIRTPSAGRSTRNIVAPSSERAITMPTEAPTMPVMNALRPFTTQWLPSGLAVVSIMPGSDPAPLSVAGSVIRKAERARPATSGSRKRAFCSGPRHAAEQEHVALVRRRDVHRQRAERRQAGGAQHQGGVAVAEVAAIRQDVRRHQAVLARLAAHLLPPAPPWDRARPAWGRARRARSRRARNAPSARRSRPRRRWRRSFGRRRRRACGRRRGRCCGRSACWRSPRLIRRYPTRRGRSNQAATAATRPRAALEPAPALTLNRSP